MKQAETYLRAVRKGLADAPAEDRERLMKRLTEAVSAYLEEDPEAGEADIIKVFGTPEACAAELLEECDLTRVAAVRRKRHIRTYAIIAALLILIAVILAALFFWKSTGTAGAPEIPMEPTEYVGGSLPHSGHSEHDAGHH